MNESLDLTNQFDLMMLWPNFASITFSLPETTEQLSALFVAILFLFFWSFLAISLWEYAVRASKAISNLNVWLEHWNNTSSPLNCSTFKGMAKNTKGYEKHLWKEFADTLEEVEKDGKPELHRTLDAHHFFNSSTLAAGITESRMLAAVPGFLTAVGVIGTFVGLQLGLSGLNPGNNADISVMKAGIGIVIAGAKTAFMTSVWGVFLSVLFNIIEKFLEGRIRRRIHKLQIQIDELFPRLNSDSLFLRIAKAGEQSRETLQGLAEKIGDKMQESLLQVSAEMVQAIQDGIKGVLTDPVEVFSVWKTEDLDYLRGIKVIPIIFYQKFTAAQAPEALN